MIHSKLISFIFCFITLMNGYSQDSTNTAGIFEGKVTYIHQILNPNKGLISDEEFFRDMPNQENRSSHFILKPININGNTKIE